MGYNIEVTKEALKSLKKLPFDVTNDIKNKIIMMAENAEIINHKKLKGNYYTDMYKLRSGDYRIIYSMNKAKNIIYIEYLGHRKNVYKQF